MRKVRSSGQKSLAQRHSVLVKIPLPFTASTLRFLNQYSSSLSPQGMALPQADRVQCQASLGRVCISFPFQPFSPMVFPCVGLPFEVQQSENTSGRHLPQAVCSQSAKASSSPLLLGQSRGWVYKRDKIMIKGLRMSVSENLL